MPRCGALGNVLGSVFGRRGRILVTGPPLGLIPGGFASAGYMQDILRVVKGGIAMPGGWLDSALSQRPIDEWLYYLARLTLLGLVALRTGKRDRNLYHGHCTGGGGE